jgi:hypothetical protein
MLIGLCGKPQSGKSEVRTLLERVGYQTVNTKAPLIAACSALTGMDERYFLSQSGKKMLYKGVPLRTIMGKVQDTIEELFGDYHSIERSLNTLDCMDYVVVDSLRKTQPLSFPGLIVEVVSDRSIDTGSDFDQYSRDRIDYTIENNGTFGELEDKVFKMLEELGIR